MSSLKSRLEDYENAQEPLLLKRVPIIIRSELRNYKKLTQNLEKPFSSRFIDLIAQTMLFAIVDIQDAVFGYCTGYEITFILKNDKFDYEPWNGNNLQRIVSTVSSLLTNGFYRYLDMFEEDFDLTGHAVFVTKAFVVPYIGEATNNLIWRQNICLKNSINDVVGYEYSKKFLNKKENVLGMRSDEDKLDSLLHDFGIEFIEYFPQKFYRGVAVYKVPTIINSGDDSSTRNKWSLNSELPDFVEEKDFINNILINGSDVIRAEYILNK